MLHIIYTAIQRSISIIQIAVFVVGTVLRRLLDHPSSLLKRLRASPPSAGDHEAQSPGAHSKKAEELHTELSPTKKENSMSPKRYSNGITSAKQHKAGREISKWTHAEDKSQDEEVLNVDNTVESGLSELVTPNENITSENLFQSQQPHDMCLVSPRRKKAKSTTRFSSNARIPSQPSASAVECEPPVAAASSLLPRTMFNKTAPSFWTPAPQILVTISAPKAASRQRRHKRSLTKLLTDSTRPNLNREASRFSGPLHALDMNQEYNH